MNKHWKTGLALALCLGLCASPAFQDVSEAAVRAPQASGSVTYSNGIATLDASNASQGYCMIQYSGGVPKIKVQISKDGVTYTYDLNARSAYEVFPFSEGNGSYTVKVFEQVTGNQYSQVLSQTVSVTLADEFGPFLYPNQYVNFSEGSSVVSVAAQITAGADEIGKVRAVYDYVVGNFTYDTAKAQSVQSGYLPNVDQVLAEKKGICFDYAAVMTAMLRSQDIPTKLVVGYTGNVYHAWVNVYIKEIGWVDNFIYFDGVSWKLMDPTFASSGKNSEAVKQYIGDGANYKSKYSY
ncbi:MAG TPA: transglutaminase domain-containing protein [Candidatus Ventrimonas merdavium]|nr:transglutaminase domain-containing protein [Candidatus Ventrimonas merdavium]